MNFTILDTAAAYQALLSAPDVAARKAIFHQEIIEPFRGLVNVMGGGDAEQVLARWGISSAPFEGAQQEQMRTHLQTLVSADAWNQSQQALEDGAKAFEGFAVPERDVVFGLILADLSNIPLQRGYSGFGAIPGWIMTIYGVPDAYNLHRIKACTAHELHHNILARIFPVNMATWTVGEYMIMEGLAESFAQELYGEDTIGYWVTDFDMTQLPETKRIFADALEKSGFGVIRGYIFGDDFAGAEYGIERVGVPAFAGYALGYHVVQAYLRRTGKSVAEATFVPARDIIRDSAFFA
jgi:uncharacterized protein YjaZ